eukprot:gene5115-biopygen10100
MMLADSATVSDGTHKPQVEHDPSEEQKVMLLKQTIAERMRRYDILLKDKVISEVSYATHKNRVVQEAVEAIEAQNSTSPKPIDETFTPEEIKRMPWLKELLNQRDLWKRHSAAVHANIEDWETNVRRTYMAKATSKSLSPLLALIGQYLLFFRDNEEGRRRLLEILFLQDADSRLKIHNWFMLSTAGNGHDVRHGHKVETLCANVPMERPCVERAQHKDAGRRVRDRGANGRGRLPVPVQRKAP